MLLNHATFYIHSIVSKGCFENNNNSGWKQSILYHRSDKHCERHEIKQWKRRITFHRQRPPRTTTWKQWAHVVINLKRKITKLFRIELNLSIIVYERQSQCFCPNAVLWNVDVISGGSDFAWNQLSWIFQSNHDKQTFTQHFVVANMLLHKPCEVCDNNN